MSVVVDARALSSQEADFQGLTGAELADATVGANDAMAGDYQRQGILGHDRSDGPGGAGDARGRGQIAIRDDLSKRNSGASGHDSSGELGRRDGGDRRFRKDRVAGPAKKRGEIDAMVSQAFRRHRARLGKRRTNGFDQVVPARRVKKHGPCQNERRFAPNRGETAKRHVENRVKQLSSRGAPPRSGFGWRRKLHPG